jgi:hypothetical protein
MTYFRPARQPWQRSHATCAPRAADPRAGLALRQAKVPSWRCRDVAGPPLDDVMKNVSEPSIKDLIPRLAPRRVPIEDAQKIIAGFVVGTMAEREHKGMLLFAGFFDRLNRERTEVMNGLERLGRRQKELAEKIRTEISELDKLLDAVEQNEAKTQELSTQVEWDKRIFEDRRQTVRYVCEVPTLIEQRLFALGRAVQQAME